jgi:hypothetical protein
VRITKETAAKEAAQALIDRFFGNETSRRVWVHIPPHATDTDVILMDYIKQSAAEIAELRAELEALYTKVSF